VWAGEEDCDDQNGSNADECLNSCVFASCGDGFVRTEANNNAIIILEECDDGNSDNGDDCLNSCELAECGDGFVNVNNETCDDQNAR
jgi:cysteine-rich repeat protein